MALPGNSKQAGLFQAGPAAPADVITIHIDGGARGNPGPGGYGAVFTSADGKKLEEMSRYLGRCTNNFAEYSGLIAALEHALEKNWKRVRVLGDSELLVRQMNGLYKVRSPELRPLYEQAKSLSRKFEFFEISHIRREQNKLADKLANAAMDEGGA